MTLNSLGEHSSTCSLRNTEPCDLCDGVRTGLGRVAVRAGGMGEEMDGRVSAVSKGRQVDYL